MNIQICTVTLLVPLIFLSPMASAQSQADAEGSNSPTWQQLDPAWSGVSSKIVEFIGEDKQKLLADLAYAAVAGDLCQDLKLDRNKFQTAFDGSFTDNNQATMSKEALASFGQKVSMYFGVYVGLLTSAGMLERDSFCDAAFQAIAKGETGFWLPNTAANSSGK